MTTTDKVINDVIARVAQTRARNQVHSIMITAPRSIQNPLKVRIVPWQMQIRARNFDWPWQIWHYKDVKDVSRLVSPIASAMPSAFRSIDSPFAGGVSPRLSSSNSRGTPAARIRRAISISSRHFELLIAFLPPSCAKGRLVDYISPA